MYSSGYLSLKSVATSMHRLSIFEEEAVSHALARCAHVTWRHNSKYIYDLRYVASMIATHGVTTSESWRRRREDRNASYSFPNQVV